MENRKYLIMEKKNSQFILDGNGNKVLEVYFEIQSLKNLFRQGWLQNGIDKKHCESVADHSFSITMLAWLLAEEYFPEFNLTKVLQYSLIHEIGEIYAGDITPSDNITDSKKYDLESEAVRKVFNKLKNGDKYFRLWEEFELGKNQEAKFVKQMDKLEMALQAHYYENTLEVNLQDFKDSTKSVLKDNILKDLLKSIK